MDKYEIAQILREIGMMIELIDDNPKKGIAYKRAAHSVESIHQFEKVVEQKQLESFPGIGKEISKMITTLFHYDHLHYYDELLKKIPKGLFELIFIPGLGLRKIRTLYEKYQITNLSDLEEAFIKDENNQLKGFGPVFKNKILKQINKLRVEGYRLLYNPAKNIAKAYLDKMSLFTNRIEIVGALRRKCELINELNFIATSNHSGCLSEFVHYGLTQEVIIRENSYAKVKLKQGITATLQLVEEEDYPYQLFILTGNDAHLHEVKKEAERIGVNLSSTTFDSEEQIYHACGVPYLVPELREGFGEVEAYKHKGTPTLIEASDLQGAFHCHTVDSDGRHTIEEMAEEAKKLGWKYIGISDHSKSSYQAHGMSEERLLNQIEQIESLNRNDPSNFKIFSGVECDVLNDGQLDFSDEILKHLDFVIVSIHSGFKQNEEEITKRLIKAIENPMTTMVGHLTGRLLKIRDPYKVNVPKVIDAAIANNKIIELNSSPYRLDMDWRFWIQAKDKGLKCCINPDAHSIQELQNCFLGVMMARKGRLEKKDVINSLTLKEMKKYLKEKKV